MLASVDEARKADIREWDLERRLALHDGPLIHIFCGDKLVAKLSQQLLASVSTLLEVRAIDSTNPAAIAELRLPANLEAGFVNHIVTWLQKFCSKSPEKKNMKAAKTVEKKNIEAPKTVWGDLNVLRAARLMGMDK